MGKVLLDMSISLDGVVARQNDFRLHDWYFRNKDDQTACILNELKQNTGAIIMGRTTFNMADEHDGFTDHPYRVPHIVLTHAVPENPPNSQQEFLFVQGVKSALDLARSLAGNKDIYIYGGVSTAKQYLEAGLVEEIQLHLVPLLLHEGSKLFELDRLEPQALECVRMHSTPEATHLKYVFIK